MIWSGLWSRVIAGTLALLLVFTLGGWFGGNAAWGLCAGALGCLIWHLSRLYRLELWLRDDTGMPPPATGAGGIWGEIHHRLLRLERQHRRHERMLTESLGQFRDVAAALPDAAVVVDDADHVLWCNEASRRLLGLRLPQDIGQRLVDLVRHPAFVDLLAARDYDGSVEFPSPVDEAPRLSVRLVPYGQGQRLMLATDISQLHRLEQIRRDFVANVSHELRTPLTVVSGYLETMLDSEDPGIEKWRQPLRRMQQQTGRMLHIIADLLMLARLETESDRKPHSPVAVPGMLAGIVEDAGALSGERAHKLEAEVDQGLWISGHEQELRSAFSNLVFNAVRYTPAGRRIVVRWFADERGIHFEVEDNGEGIAAHHIPRLTERFYRVDRGRQRESGGTGLGLAIVKHVLYRHRAQLRIASRVGTGSTFTCDFLPELRVVAAPPLTGRTLDTHRAAR